MTSSRSPAISQYDRKTPSRSKPARSASRRAATFSGATKTCTRPRSSIRERPVGEQAKHLGRDSASACGRDETAADLTHLVLPQHHHRLPEIRIAFALGDHEMEQATLLAARLVELDHARAVGRRQRRHPAGCRRVLLEVECSVEVVLPEGAQSKGRADERRLGIRDGRVDGRIVRSALPVPVRHAGRCAFTIAQQAKGDPDLAGSNRLLLGYGAAVTVVRHGRRDQTWV